MKQESSRRSIKPDKLPAFLDDVEASFAKLKLPTSNERFLMLRTLTVLAKRCALLESDVTLNEGKQNLPLDQILSFLRTGQDAMRKLLAGREGDQSEDMAKYMELFNVLVGKIRTCYEAHATMDSPEPPRRSWQSGR